MGFVKYWWVKLIKLIKMVVLVICCDIVMCSTIVIESVVPTLCVDSVLYR